MMCVVYGEGVREVCEGVVCMKGAVVSYPARMPVHGRLGTRLGS